MDTGTVYVITSPGRSLSLSELARGVPGQPLEAEASVVPGSRDYIVNSFGAHFAEVGVDTETGQVRVLQYVAAHDSGRILNPALAVNQVEGGVSQMLGFTLTEEMITDGRIGPTLNASYLEHKSPTILEFPSLQVIFADVVDPVGPFGASHRPLVSHRASEWLLPLSTPSTTPPVSGFMTFPRLRTGC